jgi:hypothetical protein
MTRLLATAALILSLAMLAGCTSRGYRGGSAGVYTHHYGYSPWRGWDRYRERVVVVDREDVEDAIIDSELPDAGMPDMGAPDMGMPDMGGGDFGGGDFGGGDVGGGDF